MTAFTGTGRLVQLALRRDRIQLPIWLVVIVGVLAALTSSVTGIYDTHQEQLSYATTNVASAVARAFNGAIAGPSLGSIVAAETFVFLSVIVALMSGMTVVRHTRQNEETGRSELIGAGVVGRHAPLTAALIVTVGTNLVLAGGATGVLVASGLPGSGSVAMGLALAGVGISFAAIGAIAAQIPESARGANGLTAAVLGGAFLLRAIGDVTGAPRPDGLAMDSGWVSWLSPIGWAQQIHPYDSPRWWPFGILVGFFLVAVGFAFLLTAHRDVGMGMVPARRGPRTAPRWLLSPIGLAWRLHRGVLLGWTIAIAVLGLAFGTVSDEIDDFAETSDAIAEYFTQMGGTDALLDAYLAYCMGLFGLAVAGYAVQALLRTRTEEASGRLEPVLAAAVSRPRWMLSHLVCVLAGVVVLLLTAGVTVGLTYGLIAADLWGQLLRLTGAALAQLPAVIVLAGLSAALFGLLPRWVTAVSWASFMICLLLEQIGELLELPQAVLNLSPFAHIPNVPVEEVTASPLLVLSTIAIGLTVVGVLLHRRRDLTPA